MFIFPPDCGRFLKPKDLTSRARVKKAGSKSGLELDVLTLFPGMFKGVFSESLLGKAVQKGLVDVRVRNIRDFAEDRHSTADDRPYGGGPGMVLKAEPVFQALRACGASRKKQKPWVVYLSPQGRPFKQADAQRLAGKKRLVLLCGHYEGIDERLMSWVDEEIGVGEAVLTGGEIPAMLVADAVIRTLPGVVKEADSLTYDSFGAGWKGLLDCPHYTRPALWRGQTVPAVLLSGHHQAVEAWRQAQSLQATRRKRPDLL